MAMSGALVNQQPYKKCQAITKSDATVYSPPLDALHIGGAGTVTVIDENGNSTQFTAIAGQILPVSCSKVMSTGTAATLIVGMNY